MVRPTVAALLLLLLCAPAGAVQPDEILSDPALEARARTISEGLRCLVCQNQSIDDSGAPLARDLRLLVRERLRSGDSDGAVRDFIVARYGDFVLLKPPFKLETAVLWIAPFAMLGLGALLLLLRRHSAGNAASPSLEPEEEARLEGLLRRK